MNYRKWNITVIIKLLAALAVSSFAILGFGLDSLAQGLTLDAGTTATFAPARDYVGIALVASRVILASLFGLSAVIGFFSGYRWLTNEGNAAKAYENKHTFARVVLIITVVFILMAVMRIYVPDYSVLTF